MKVYFGTDSEFFILDRRGKPAPAHRFFPGKDDKLYFEVKERGRGALFRDGYALEINVPPAHCRSVLVDSVNIMLHKAQQRLPNGYKLTTAPVVGIDLRSLRRAPYDVQQFGCDPVLDAYLGDERATNLDGTKHRLRYSGSHFHFSVKPIPAWMKKFDNMCLLAKLMDQRIGLPLAMIFNNAGSRARRKYYGLAGEFRLQRYEDGERGFEYRVPTSEVWNDPGVAMMVMGVGRDTILNFARLQQTWDRRLELCIQRAINTGIGIDNLLVPTSIYRPDTIRWLAKKGVGRFRLQKPTPMGTLCDFGGWAQIEAVRDGYGV